MSGVPRRTVGLVIPWYSDTMGGGAETACRLLAKTLLAHGAAVEVLTTRVRDFRGDWSRNHYPEGLSMEGGVPVRRFSVRRQDKHRFYSLNDRILSGQKLETGEERDFLREMINSPALYEYLSAHRGEYVFVLLPYLYGTTFFGVRACPESAVLVPCLHDEGYARLGPMREMFAAARGVIFLSRAERELARRLYPEFRDAGVLGLPLEGGTAGDAARFEAKYGYRDFLLYAGRTDAGKKAELLTSHFERYLEETGSDLHLVFMGTKEAPGGDWRRDRIHALGFLPEQDKRDCFAASLALCVPSVMESFSLVIMESWLAGRPVIVNEECAVTTSFCQDSNGGLWFGCYEEFREVVNYLRQRPETARAMGAAGGRYVREHFAPEAVARNYLEALGEVSG